MSCSSTDCRDCCNSRVEGAPTDGASPTAAPAKPIRVASCRNCGNDPAAITRAFQAGVLAAYWDTYADNLAATKAREQAEAERQAVNRWHE
jgi:hypothetical protein